MKSKFGLPCMIFSILIWGISLYQTHLDIDESLNHFGLLSTLPPLFFLSIFFMLVALIILNETSKRFLINILIVLMIFTTVYIVGGHGAIQNIGVPLRHFGTISSIGENGQLDITLNYAFNWPSAMILFSSILQVCGIKADSAVSVITVVYVLLLILYCLPLLLILANNRILNVDQKPISIMLFFFLFWVPQHYISPQGVVYYSYILMLYCFMKVFAEKKITPQLILITIILMAFIITSHLLTSLTVLMILLALIIVGKNWERVTLLILGSVIFLGWTVYANVTFLNNYYVNKFISKLFRIDQLLLQTSMTPGSSVGGVMQHVYFQIIVALLLITLTVSALIVIRKKAWNQPIKSVCLMVLTIIAGFVIMGPMYGIYGYSGEMLQREYILLLPLCIVLINNALIKSITYQRFVMFSLFLIMPLFMLCKFGNLSCYVSPGHLSGNKFIVSSAERGTIIQDTRYSGGVYKNKNNLKDAFLSNTYKNRQSDYLLKYSVDLPGNHNYIFVSEHARRWYLFLYNDSDVIPELQNELKLYRASDIYASGDFRISYLD